MSHTHTQGWKTSHDCGTMCHRSGLGRYEPEGNFNVVGVQQQATARDHRVRHGSDEPVHGQNEQHLAEGTNIAGGTPALPLRVAVLRREVQLNLIFMMTIFSVSDSAPRSNFGVWTVLRQQFASVCVHAHGMAALAWSPTTIPCKRQNPVDACASPSAGPTCRQPGRIMLLPASHRRTIGNTMFCRHAEATARHGNYDILALHVLCFALHTSMPVCQRPSVICSPACRRSSGHDNAEIPALQAGVRRCGGACFGSTHTHASAQQVTGMPQT